MLNEYLNELRKKYTVKCTYNNELMMFKVEIMAPDGRIAVTAFDLRYLTNEAAIVEKIQLTVEKYLEND